MGKINRGLVLSGGGIKGAFQVGALKYLLEDLGKKYDVVSGFSIGALNGAMVVQGDFEKLIGMWMNLRSLWDIVGGNPRFYKGFFSTKPLEKLVSSNLDVEKIRKSETELLFTCVDLVKGELVECDKHIDPLLEWLMASASIPGAFPPRIIGGKILADGGVLATKPLASAIRCGVDEIDVIICQPLEKRESKKKPESIMDTVLRCLELAEGDMMRTDVERCRLINKVIGGWNETKQGSGFFDEIIIKKMEKKGSFPFSHYRRIEVNIIDSPTDVIGVFEVKPEKIRYAINVGYERAKKVMEKSMKVRK